MTRHQVVAAVQRALAATAPGSPTMLCVEDAHLLDEATADGQPDEADHDAFLVEHADLDAAVGDGDGCVLTWDGAHGASWFVWRGAYRRGWAFPRR